MNNGRGLRKGGVKSLDLLVDRQVGRRLCIRTLFQFRIGGKRGVNLLRRISCLFKLVHCQTIVPNFNHIGIVVAPLRSGKGDTTGGNWKEREIVFTATLTPKEVFINYSTFLP